MPRRPALVWLNGCLVPIAEAAVSIEAHGVLYGDGIFETVRVYGRRAFRLDRHLARLFDGAGIIGLELGWEPPALEAAVTETLAAQALCEAVVRITALRGAGPPGPDPTQCGAAVLFITAREYAGYPDRLYQEGARALLATSRQNEFSPLCRVKSLSYLNHILARAEARRAGAEEALLLNTRGEIAEGSMSNLFIRCGDRLLTPCLESGCLPGIARREVIELAAGVGLTPSETRVTVEALLQADEVLLTNSLIEVAPCVRLGEHTIGAGVPGDAAEALRQAYLARARDGRELA